MNRVIRKSQSHAADEAASLLANLFSAELLAPSACIWLVSPWISNIPLLNNEANSYSPLANWGPRRVRLAEILATLAATGSHVVLATTKDSHNDSFIGQLRSRAAEVGADRLITVDRDQRDLLHEKAIIGDGYALVGSMNITWNGVMVNEEFLELRTDEEFVARARSDARDRFGGLA